MDVQAFWIVIGTYNQHTIAAQAVLLVFLVCSVILSYQRKNPWMAKFALGIANLFIGIVFFAWYGTEPIQKYFALPLYLLCGGLFLFESWHNREDILEQPNFVQSLLLLFYVCYPLVSVMLGNRCPRMVTYIMPCPVASLSIAVYTGCQKKNKLLLALLTIWGLTGIKSVIFSAYEDLILLACGLYGLTRLLKETKREKIVRKSV